MKFSNLTIYVISLPADEKRRLALRERFDPISKSFRIVDGIRILETTALLENYKQKNYDEKLTKSELGCALSHVHALQDFLLSDANYALILEDDAIGSAEGINTIADAIAQLPNDTFLLCGGQEGLRGEPYNYGATSGIHNVYKIPRIARKFYTRACCYCVTKPSAQRIVSLQRNSLGLSDQWDLYFKDWENFFFIKAISHPYDLSDSNIEQDRYAQKAKSELSRIKQDGLLRIIRRFVSKVLLRSFSRQLGLTQIK